VASIFGLTGAMALDDEPDTLAAVEDWQAELWSPGIGLFRDGVLQVPGREPLVRPDLAGAFDLFGFSYYTWMGFEHGALKLYPPGAPVSPLGYGIWPEGLGVVLDRLHHELPGTPLLVAEYGIGTDDDEQRADYLRRGLQVVHDALAAGIDVRGFFHRTAVDNYEWFHGYQPTTAFGLMDVDRNVRPSAHILRSEVSGS
jgi:beta-glucosidase